MTGGAPPPVIAFSGAAWRCAMYDFQDMETRRAIDRIGQKMLQNVVELALEDGYSHGVIAGGLIKQAYTVMRLTLPVAPEERKAMFLRLAGEIADAIEEATQPRA
jgi:hypothetical protein